MCALCLLVCVCVCVCVCVSVTVVPLCACLCVGARLFACLSGVVLGVCLRHRLCECLVGVTKSKMLLNGGVGNAPTQTVLERSIATVKQGLFGVLFVMAKDNTANNAFALVRPSCVFALVRSCRQPVSFIT